MTRVVGVNVWGAGSARATCASNATTLAGGARVVALLSGEGEIRIRSTAVFTCEKPVFGRVFARVIANPVARPMSLIIEPDAESGRGRRWCEIENDFAALRKRLDLKNVSFSNLRDTSSTKVESIDRTLTDLFDGHKDGRMARFYIDGSKIDYDQMFGRLDRAIDELGLYYELKLATKALSSCSQRRQAHSTTEGLVTSYSLGANIRQAGKITSRFSGMPLFTLGGAVARVPEDATAFPGRSAQHNLNIVGA